jgi:uncharacterized delta-60 repeat protein
MAEPPRTSLLRVALVGLLAIVAAVLTAPVAVMAAGRADLEELPSPALPADASAREAGIVDLAGGTETPIFGALAGQGKEGYFGAVALDKGGAPDASFGEGGFSSPLKLPFGGFDNLAPEAEALATQRDGKVVVVGYSQEGTREPVAFAPLLARYRSDGSLDQSFSTDGIASSPPQGRGGIQLHDVAIAKDRTILVVGGRDEAGEGVAAPAGVVYAYRPDGNRDTSFGKHGQVLFKGRHSSLYSTLRGIQVLPSGKILVVGYLDARLLLARLNPNGKLDRRFGGGDGRVTLDLHSHACCEGAALAPAPKGRVVVAGMGGGFSKYRVFLARYLSSGRLDRHFGDKGVEASLQPHRLAALLGLAVDGSGRIVTTGRNESTKGNPGYSFAAFRNLANGRPDRRFGRGGMSVLRGGAEGIAGAALTVPSGVLVGGSYLSPQSEGAAPMTKLLLGRIGTTSG